MINSMKLLTLLILTLGSNTAFAVGLPTGATGGAGLMKNIPAPSSTVQAGSGSSIYTEVHAAQTQGSSPPNYACSQGGTFVQGSLHGSNNNAWSYECYVVYTTAQYQNNPTVQQEKTSWVTVANTTDTGNPAKSDTDIVTLRFPNGFPATTYITYDDFGWGNGVGDLCYAGINWSVNGANGPQVNQSGDNCNATSAASTTVAPYQSIGVSKNVWHNWNDSCSANYTVQPNDIGQTVTLDCCPENNNNQGNTSGNVNWCPGCGVHGYIVQGWCP